MNCQDVTAILDDLRVEALDPVLRRQAEAHVAGCVECARAWNAQASLSLLPDMPFPADFRARCRTAVAAGPRATSSRHIARGVLASSLAALAAAAAVMTSLLRPADTVSTENGSRVPGLIPGAAGTASVEQHSAAPVPALAIEQRVQASFSARLEILEPAVISGPRTDSDPYKEQALQSMYAAMREELRKVPGLALVESDSAEAGSASRHYVVKVGQTTYMEPDGRILRDRRHVNVHLGAVELQSDGKKIERGIRLRGARIDLLANCSGSALPAATACHDAQGAAANLVLQLRQEVFPPDASMTRPLQARFRDSSLDSTQRLKLLVELFQLQDRVGDNRLLRDADMVRASIQLAASSDPALRSQVWRSLRGVGNRELIEPLIASMLQDPEEVRLAAIETLAADFSDDTRVRSALEAAAAGDTRPLVRAVARRSLSGEESWRQYVVSSLTSASLPAPQRLEALAYYLYPPGPDERSSPGNPQYFQIMDELLDDAALRALAEALPKAGRLRDNGGGNLLSNVGYHFNKNPAVTAMLLDFLEHDPQPRMRTIAGEVLARTHPDEPRVRDALAKALRSDPDPGVRDWIRQVLGDKAP